MTFVGTPFSLKARAYYKFKQYGFIYLSHCSSLQGKITPEFAAIC